MNTFFANLNWDSLHAMLRATTRQKKKKKKKRVKKQI